MPSAAQIHPVQLDGGQLDNAMPVRRRESGGFCIDDDFSHQKGRSSSRFRFAPPLDAGGFFLPPAAASAGAAAPLRFLSPLGLALQKLSGPPAPPTSLSPTS